MVSTPLALDLLACVVVLVTIPDISFRSLTYNVLLSQASSYSAHPALIQFMTSRGYSGGV